MTAQRDNDRRERMLTLLEGLPTHQADEMPPGSICGFCALHRHVFVYPKDIPGSHWSLVDGCPCCETHVPASDEQPNTPWPSDPPLGVAS